MVDPKMFENVWNKRVIDNKPYRVDICGTVGVTVVDPNNRIIDNKPYTRAHGKRTASTGQRWHAGSGDGGLHTRSKPGQVEPRFGDFWAVLL